MSGNNSMSLSYLKPVISRIFAEHPASERNKDLPHQCPEQHQLPNPEPIPGRCISSYDVTDEDDDLSKINL